jgi:hypothetical protein
MRPQQGRTRLRVPSDIVLTSRSLAAIGRKLATTELHVLVETLIEELDIRCGDPDFESEPDEESE